MHERSGNIFHTIKPLVIGPGNSWWGSSLILLLIGVIALSGCGGGASTAFPSLDETLVNTATELQIEFASAVLIKNGEMVWQKNYGEAAGSNDIYGMGSVSKSFVAVLALLLEEEGRLISLDDKISDYLPELDFWNKDRVTLRELLSMRSGIADYLTNFNREDYFKEYDATTLIDKGLSRSALLKQGSFTYSNTNTLIAVQMMEKATGESVEQLIREKILIPLKLNNTFFAEEKSDIRERLVPGYSEMITAQRVDFTAATTSWASLACGMYSTAKDMARWGNALMYGPFLSEESREKLLDFLPTGDAFDYGLGIAREQINGEKIYVLRGNVPGYGAVIYLFDNTSLAVLSNLSNYRGNGPVYVDSLGKELLRFTYDKEGIYLGYCSYA